MSSCQVDRIIFAANAVYISSTVWVTSGDGSSSAASETSGSRANNRPRGLAYLLNYFDAVNICKKGWLTILFRRTVGSKGLIFTPLLLDLRLFWIVIHTLDSHKFPSDITRSIFSMKIL